MEVAAVTFAVIDTAMAAAQVAAAVVRLIASRVKVAWKIPATNKIQTVFRGYLVLIRAQTNVLARKTH
ncbi:---NA--- [Olea europaea subsp. europaea]|uniref:---NA n=1 Tax=Olea europaea subsp. europaea TaxID=158383 RepID=A0A8S0R5I9_OLEEU|nr:---NA--- [Olea europaea subsp. europaea]